MTRSGEYLHELIGKKRDGSEARFDIYKVGGSLRVVPQDGGEPTLVGRDRKLESEMRIVYGVVEIL